MLSRSYNTLSRERDKTDLISPTYSRCSVIVNIFVKFQELVKLDWKVFSGVQPLPFKFWLGSVRVQGFLQTGIAVFLHLRKLYIRMSECTEDETDTASL